MEGHGGRGQEVREGWRRRKGGREGEGKEGEAEKQVQKANKSRPRMMGRIRAWEAKKSR